MSPRLAALVVALAEVEEGPRRTGPRERSDPARDRLVRSLLDDRVTPAAVGDALARAIERTRERRTPRRRPIALAVAALVASVSTFQALRGFVVQGFVAEAPLLLPLLGGLLALTALILARTRRSSDGDAPELALAIAYELLRLGVSTAKALDAALFVAGASAAEVRRRLDRAWAPDSGPDRLRAQIAVVCIGPPPRPRSVQALGTWVAYAAALLVIFGFWTGYFRVLAEAARRGGLP